VIRSEGEVGEFRVNPSLAHTVRSTHAAPQPPLPRATRAAPFKRRWVRVSEVRG